MSGDTQQKWSIGLELGAALAAARKRARKTKDDVATAHLGSRQKTWRMETGVGPYKVADVRALAELYEVSGQERELWTAMAAASEDSTWTEKAEVDSPPRFGLFMLIERQAAITAVNEEMINGLAQTVDYHCALLDFWGLDKPAAQLRLRQDRQEAFWGQESPRLRLILPEAALRHQIGGAAVMQAQINHLRSLAERTGVSVLWVPVSCGPHRAMKGAFTILSTLRGESVYTEHLDGGRILADPDTVQRYKVAAETTAELACDIKEFR